MPACSSGAIVRTGQETGPRRSGKDSSSIDLKEFPIYRQKFMDVVLFVVQSQPDVKLIEKRLEVVPPVTWRIGEVMNRNGHPHCTGNVLLGLDFNDAEELSAKAALALKLNGLINQRGLSQTEAAALLA